MAGRIIINIDLNDSVTLEQFNGVVRYTAGALQQFQHLISNVEIEATPPSLVAVPLNITVAGLPVDVAAENVLSKVTEALKSADGVQYTVQVAGGVAETPQQSSTPSVTRLALTPPTVSRRGLDGPATATAGT